MRARMNHFRETDFVGDGAPLMGAALHDEPSWGAERLGRMLNQAVTQALTGGTCAHAKVALLVLCANPDRPGMPTDDLDEALGAWVNGGHAGWGPFHSASRLYPAGKGGIGQALHAVASLLAQPQSPEQVLLVGIDSLLNAATVEHHLEQARLATPLNADGMVPGEAAAAVLLALEPPGAPALSIEAAASATDTWRIGGEEPMRARALTAAMRAAAIQAGMALMALDFHASGMTGESWYAKESNMALSRALEGRAPTFPQMAVASFAGETGAAAPVLTLAWLAHEMAREDGPGRSALLHFAEDDGRRSALVVRHRRS